MQLDGRILGLLFGSLMGFAILGTACGSLAAEPSTERNSIESESIVDHLCRLLSSRIRRLQADHQKLRQKIADSPPLSRRIQIGRLGFHSTPAEQPDEQRSLTLRFDTPQDLTTIALVPARVDSTIHAGEDYGFPRRFRIDVSADGQTFQTIADETDQDVPSPGGYPYQVHGKWRATRAVRITAIRLWPIHDRWGWAIGEVMLLAGQRQVGPLATVIASQSYEAPTVWSRDYVNDGQSILGLPVAKTVSPTSGYLALRDSDPKAEKWIQVDLAPETGEPPLINEVCLVPARPIDYADRAAYGFPPRFRVLASNDSLFTDYDVIADYSEEEFPCPGDNPVIIVVAPEVRKRYVRFEAVELWDCSWKCSFAIAELQVRSGDENISEGKPVTVADVVQPEHARGLWAPEYAVDGYSGHHRLLPPATWLRQLGERQATEARLAKTEKELAQAKSSLISLLSVLAVLSVAGLGGWIVVLRGRRKHEDRLLRQRIAGDLHDDLGSNLGSIALTSGLLVRSADLPQPQRDDIGRIQRIANDTLHSLRDLVWLIDAPPGQLSDFHSRVVEAAASLLGEIEHEVEIDPASKQCKLSMEFRRHFYLAVKEILHNVSRHSGATYVRVTISTSGSLLRIVVQDNGCGFDTGASSLGHGLRSLQRRAESFGGKVAVQSDPQNGTTVTLEGPVA